MHHAIQSQLKGIAVFIVAMFFLLSLGAAPAAAQGVVIVANKSLKVNTVSKEDIAAVFLGKKSSWSSGEAAVFAVFDDEGTQEKFMLKYIEKRPSQFKNYWKKRVFTGKGRMPKYLKSKEEVLEFVKANSGAVSFLPDSADNAVKVLKVK